MIFYLERDAFLSDLKFQLSPVCFTDKTYGKLILGKDGIVSWLMIISKNVPWDWTRKEVPVVYANFFRRLTDLKDIFLASVVDLVVDVRGGNKFDRYREFPVAMLTTYQY